MCSRQGAIQIHVCLHLAFAAEYGYWMLVSYWTCSVRCQSFWTSQCAGSSSETVNPFGPPCK